MNEYRDLIASLTTPPSPEEVARRNAEVARANEEAYRRRVIEGNRRDNYPEPKVGMKLYVTTVRGIKMRGRAGLVFSEAPNEVTVVDGSDEDVLTKQKHDPQTGVATVYVVNAWGAEQIFADSNRPGERGLYISMTKPGEIVTPETMTTEALEAELTRRKTASVQEHEDRIRSRQHPKSKDSGAA